jgi:hypothetical protein
MIISFKLFLIITILQSLIVVHVANSILTEVRNQRKKLLELNELLSRKIFTGLASIILIILYSMAAYSIAQAILLLK